MQALVRQTPSSSTSASARAALLPALDRIFGALPHGRGWATYPFNTLTLGSHFQPIFQADTGRLFGYEGLLHAVNLSGAQLKPETVFALSGDCEQELFLDWLCRGLHLRNVANLGSNRAERGLIFLNAYPQAAIEDPRYPEVFARMIAFYGLSPRDVVVEILEAGASDDVMLADAVTLYRQLGCKIAIDDFGTGFSNFERLWRLRPDYVKIDRSVLKSAMGERHARLVLANMIRLIHSCGALVVVEGIEERSEASLAIELGTDFVQGYFFARPAAEAFPTELAENIVVRLIDEHRETSQRSTEDLSAHIEGLTKAAAAIKAGVSFSDAVEPFAQQPNAARAYLLQDDQMRHERMILDMTEDQAWLNLPMPDSAAWRLRNLAERALAVPNAVQVTAPLSVTTVPPVPTFTLSMAFELDGRNVILCGDVLAPNVMMSMVSDSTHSLHGDVSAPSSAAGRLHL